MLGSDIEIVNAAHPRSQPASKEKKRCPLDLGR